MIRLDRSSGNPILLPSIASWEAKAAFNGCVIKDNGKFHMVYRALSDAQVSSIGYAESQDGIRFTNNKQLIAPKEKWESFGCEDPRIIKIDNEYFIFYTAISNYPFNKDCIKVGVGITTDLKIVRERHLVTPFNAKAMALFPEKINGKYVGILTANTDMPPSKISIAFFNSKKDLWDNKYWSTWYSDLDKHALALQRSINDQVEVGAPPIKTKDGWLLLYSYINNYLSDPRIFGIEAVLLDLKNPLKILGRTRSPLLTPEKDYELYGNVPNIVFPSGALVHKEKVFVYYGASDTSCCLATCDLKDLLEEFSLGSLPSLFRFPGNPIIEAKPNNSWEAKATFNPGAFLENGKAYIVYRAMGNDNTSVFGYAASTDGFHISERLNDPIYVPRETFEMKTKDSGNSGCEDPRITKIGERLYICYTAFDGTSPPRVALTSIKVQDFINKIWNFEKPKLISPPDMDDKDACIFPRKINGKYVIFHRPGGKICIAFSPDLEFKEGTYITGKACLELKSDIWRTSKLGIAAPPIETEKGWLLLYHGVSSDLSYKVGAALLDLDDPARILSKTYFPILEPQEKYEKEGQVPNVVFPCGMVEIGGDLFVYYGGADKVVCVAIINKAKLLKELAY